VKKLDYNHLTTGALTVDASHLIGVVNDLIDIVNSQQEAIEKLEKRMWEVDTPEGGHNIWGRDIDKRLCKVEAESKAMGEALVTHYNHPDAHKPIAEEPLEMVSKARYAEKLGIHNNPHEHVYRCQDCEKMQAEVTETDTHRTVTLRIPKGMTVGEIFEEIDNTYDWARWGGRWFGQLKDEEVKILFDEVTQKALDEVQPNE